MAGWLWAPLVLLATVAVRAFGNARGYDVFVDEVTYLRVSESVAQDLGVRLYGEPFFPAPAGHVLPRRWLADRLRSLPGRHRRGDGRSRSGLPAGRCDRGARGAPRARARRPVGSPRDVRLVLLDPFLVRINSRNLLETPTLLFVLAGLLVLAGPLARDERLTLRRAAAGGALLGLGVLTKDTAALAVSLPLLYLLARRAAPAVAALAAGATLVLTYLPYPLVSALVGSLGHAGGREEHRRDAAQRPRPADRLQRARRRVVLGPDRRAAVLLRRKLALMAAGGFAALYLVLRGRPAHRLVGWWSGASTCSRPTAWCGDPGGAGFYFVLLPAAVVVPVAIAAWAARRAPSAPARSLVPVWGLVLLGGLDRAGMLAYAEVHTQRDDAYAQMVAFVDDELGGRTAPRIGVTSDPASVLLRGSQIFRVSTPGRRPAAAGRIRAGQHQRGGERHVLGDPRAAAHDRPRRAGPRRRGPQRRLAAAGQGAAVTVASGPRVAASRPRSSA